MVITYSKKSLRVLAYGIRSKPIANFPDVLIQASSGRVKASDRVSTPSITTPRVPCPFWQHVSFDAR